MSVPATVNFSPNELPKAAHPPDAFEYVINEGIATISHKRTGMPCLVLFVCFVNLGFTLAWIRLLQLYLTTGQAIDGRKIEMEALFLFAIPTLFLTPYLCILVFEKKTFSLGIDAFKMITSVFGIRKEYVSIPYTFIVRVEQIKDGGVDKDDSFHSWGLMINLKDCRSIQVLGRLPYDQSEWLGIILATASNTNLRLCQKT